MIPNDFEDAIIADQLRYAGVLEAIRVSRVGYSQRYSHDMFVSRYGFIAHNEKKIDVLVKEIAKKIWHDLNPNEAP